jgi:diaminopimelate decarboxylase
MYDAYHEIVPVKKQSGRMNVVDIVGPVCESGDYLARGRKIHIPAQNDLLAILTAGAYGFSMSSQYNSRPRVPEILISGNRFDVIRERETIKDLLRGEKIPGHLK